MWDSLLREVEMVRTDALCIVSAWGNTGIAFSKLECISIDPFYFPGSDIVSFRDYFVCDMPAYIT